MNASRRGFLRGAIAGLLSAAAPAGLLSGATATLPRFAVGSMFLDGVLGTVWLKVGPGQTVETEWVEVSSRDLGGTR